MNLIFKKILFHSVIGATLGAVVMIIVSVVKTGAFTIQTISYWATVGCFIGLLVVAIRGVMDVKKFTESLCWALMLGLVWAGIAKLLIQPNRTAWEIFADVIVGMIGGLILSVSTKIFERWFVRRDTKERR